MSRSQDVEMAQILTELGLLSHGSVTRYNPSSRGESIKVLPFGEPNPPHLRFGRLYNEQTTDTGRAVVIERAAAELAQLRGRGVDRSHVTGESVVEFERRLLADGQGFTAQEVATRLHCTPTRVRRIRLANGRDADTGNPTSTSHVDEDPNQRLAVCRMGAAGYTIRQIRHLTSVPTTTIHRWLKDQALAGADQEIA